MKAVIMAGGKGTRVQSVASDIPKPMIPILNKPILEHQINSLKASGITDIILIVGHLKNAIMDYFGDGHRFGVSIRYIQEEIPLGTAGALVYLKKEMEDDFLLLYGDLILDIDFSRFIAFHKGHRSSITLFCHPNAHPYDSDVTVVDGESRIIQILNKKEPRLQDYHNLVNAGIYCINPIVMNQMHEVCKRDMEKDLVASRIKKRDAYAYRSSEYVKDMGTPGRLEQVTQDMKNGLVEARSLRNRQKAIFLDRDGTINKYEGYLTRTEQFHLLPETENAIRRINDSVYLAIVITNQPVVARGDCTFQELENIHMRMETELGKAGAYLDDVFFCPHHPDKGFAGERTELKIECNCRKPKIGMIEQAAKKYNIDLNESWFIGDSTIDIQTGKNAGMRTVLVKTGVAGEDGKYHISPDFVSINLKDAVAGIMNKRFY